jgi:hypothetical protein
MSEPTDPPAPFESGPPPPPPPGEPRAGHGGNAWERRDQLGFVEGLVSCIKSFVTKPGEAFSETRRTGDLASPLLYAIIVAVVTALIGQLWAVLFGTSILAFLPADLQEAMPLWMVSQGAGLMVGFVVMPILTLIWVFLWGAIMHVLLLLVGGLQSSEAGFDGTLRVVAYSSTGNLAKLVPVIGDLISTFWMIVLAVIGLTRIHGTSEGKAVAVVLLPLVICCVCVGAAVMMGVGAILSGLGN